MTQKCSGFTLLELMITLGAAAIIAMFAVPVYTEHMAKGRRLDAVSALYRAAQYVESAQTVANTDATSRLPSGFSQVPASGSPIYLLRLLGESEMNGGYSIEAEPVFARDDACGIFSLDATGVRSNRLVEKLTPPKVAACWGGR
jgi:type IV pilus assembly protein PilE